MTGAPGSLASPNREVDSGRFGQSDRNRTMAQRERSKEVRHAGHVGDKFGLGQTCVRRGGRLRGEECQRGPGECVSRLRERS